MAQALEALSHLPETRDKQEQAIDLRLELRGVLVPLQGFAQNLIHLHEAERIAEALEDPYRFLCVALSLWATAHQERQVAGRRHNETRRSWPLESK